MNRITILVVDDHPLFRQGVIDTLLLEPDVQVVGQASGGEEGLELMRLHCPQIAIVDVNLPGINGHQVVRKAAAEKITSRIILLTAYDDPRQRSLGLRSGAWAYCTKDIRPDLLAQVVRKVAAGKHIIGLREYDDAAFVRWLDGRSDEDADSSQGNRQKALSAREMEVLTYLVKGLSNKEIAVSLGISHQTVKNHVTAILQKLEVTDRTQAAMVAVQHGWVKI
jgi:two-component system, NarL family, response regulator DegU